MSRLDPIVFSVVIALFTLTAITAGAPVACAGAKSYTVKSGDTPFGVAKRFGISLDELYRFNSMAPGDSFTVGMTLDIPQKGQAALSEYVVKSGDSVASVSDFYGVAQDDLRRLNHIGRKAELKKGDTIQIPRRLRGGAKGHVVRKGDTIADIAKKHKVKVRNLMAANKLKDGTSLQPGRTLVIPEEDSTGNYVPLKTNRLVKSGKRVAGGVLHRVQPGQTLWVIARAYHVSKEKIASHNNMRVTDSLNAGQEIIIPGARQVVPVRVDGYVIQPIEFLSVWDNESATLRLMSKKGRISPYARKKLSQLAGTRQNGVRNKLLHPRLLHMIQRVAERYPGRRIEIISGYRPGETGQESMHTQARAMDFRVQGVPNLELYEFCTGLTNAGCGYYPNSVFIHMDARNRPATWTDYSRPGEKANYRNPNDDNSSENDDNKANPR
ncbi:MAG: LysM peptidoglycan-binding domain-containing protein [Deltaproteobacteria bacterium]|nr:LysM peptidoglycan-binding domain-containing protein [Deltaproteobacteria bacterium]